MNYWKPNAPAKRLEHPSVGKYTDGHFVFAHASANDFAELAFLLFGNGRARDAAELTIWPGRITWVVNKVRFVTKTVLH
jgi:hypothetical protein